MNIHEDESREYTEDEVRENLLSYIWTMISYWKDEARKPDTQGKLEGLAFSILTALDGCANGVPAFIVAPNPHPDDKDYLIDNGENWFPENHESEVKCNLSGSLHELFFSFRGECG